MNIRAGLTAATQIIAPNFILYRLRAYRAKARGHNPELALLPLLNHGGIFVDVGANIGDFSRVASLVFRQVIAFEPIPDLALKLRSELPRNVTVHALALSEAPGTATLYIPVQQGHTVSGLASLDRSANQLPDRAAEMAEIPVEIRTLDEFGLSDVDVIKIDVEGLEEFVLKGARETLQANRPALIVEIEDRHHPGKTVQVFQLLWDLGFDAYYYLGRILYSIARTSDDAAFQRMNRQHAGASVINFIFLHPQRSRPQLSGLIAGARGHAYRQPDRSA